VDVFFIFVVFVGGFCETVVEDDMFEIGCC